MPKDEEKSFYDDKKTCEEMIIRWHNGCSSHPDREQLAAEYPLGDEGAQKLWHDLVSIKDDPFVQAADLKLRLTKYTANP